MTGAVTRQRGARDRPLGYYPRKTSLGIVGFILLAPTVPFVGLLCASPVIPGGFDLWLDSIPYVVGFAVIPFIALVAGLRSHRYWVICLFFYFGAFLLGAWALSLPLAVAILLGAFPIQEKGLGYMTIVGIIELVLMAIPAWFLLRALRLRYWQPGSAPDTWEAGDETAPAWALSPSRHDRS